VVFLFSTVIICTATLGHSIINKLPNYTEKPSLKWDQYQQNLFSCNEKSMLHKNMDKQRGYGSLLKKLNTQYTACGLINCTDVDKLPQICESCKK